MSAKHQFREIQDTQVHNENGRDQFDITAHAFCKLSTNLVVREAFKVILSLVMCQHIEYARKWTKGRTDCGGVAMTGPRTAKCDCESVWE